MAFVEGDVEYVYKKYGNVFSALEVVDEAILDGCSFVGFKIDNLADAKEPYSVWLRKQDVIDNGYD